MENKTSEAIEASTERLLHDLKAVVRDGEDLLAAGARELGAQSLAARKRLKEALRVARQTQRRLQAKAISGARATDRVVRQHPYQTVGLAFGIGLLAGILLNRR